MRWGLFVSSVALVAESYHPNLSHSPGASFGLFRSRLMGRGRLTTRFGGLSSLRASSSMAAPSPTDSPTLDFESKKETPRVCIVGGGFGGLMTALGLARMPWRQTPQVTLIDDKDRFVFTPLLYELACDFAGEDEVCPTFRDLLRNSGIEFRQAKVTSVDVGNRQVAIAEGDDGEGPVSHLNYDKLVVSAGFKAKTETVEGATEHALPFYRLDDAQRLREELRRLDRRIQAGQPVRVCVVGGGYSGVELGANVKRRLGGGADVFVVHRGPSLMSGSSSGFNRKSAQQVLDSLGVSTKLNTGVESISATETEEQTGEQKKKVVLRQKGSSDTEETEFDLVLWTAGQAPSQVLESFRASGGFVLDAKGRLCVSRTLEAVRRGEGTRGGGSGVFAVGDVANIDGFEGGGTAQAAFQETDYLVWNLWAQLTREVLQQEDGGGSFRELEFRYAPLGELVGMGPSEGSVSLLSDRLTLDGPSAALARRLIYVFRQPTNEQRVRALRGFLSRSSESGGGISALASAFQGDSRLKGQAEELAKAAARVADGPMVKSLIEAARKSPFLGPLLAQLPAAALSDAAEPLVPESEEVAPQIPPSPLTPRSTPVFVAGATGRTGRLVVRELLLRGWRVVVGTRPGGQSRGERIIFQEAERAGLDPETLRSEGRLEVREVDLRSGSDQAVCEALGDCRFAVSCLGASGMGVGISGPIEIDGRASQTLFRAFAKCVPYDKKQNELSGHMVLVSSLGTGNPFGFPSGVLNLFGGVLLIKRLSELYLQACGVNYTIVRPGGLVSRSDLGAAGESGGRGGGEAGGQRRGLGPVGLFGPDSTFGGSVSREDVAVVCAEALELGGRDQGSSRQKIVEVIASREFPGVPVEELFRKVPSIPGGKL
uniref:FAD/NAD(P)-binding domain-containing protein n=1 Tax=Chromera velia CCMP2878 TaxID=1169474 RepID=A0A0G4HSL3_9ALVE|eukprot:Cvel_8313.t1-p1 / transcript=Cvel_8313.t1 / gene=Cvel_8313 / organism=Chromera_velia_CCMP2878 / gene_product=NADH dehydrogenase C1, chloroplastic/mitochondrial, putative / transcript_product=NADH dehydrogenase C1, chloroplastic/mitochondrial, putative / location=Cvel_scaffold456:64117-68909(+) / protein_length=883 / sequence_SO=supercontig / SO=protein_coding / is_pseudo=false